jgi:hypothetical protein
MQPVEVIEKGKFRLAPKVSGDTKQPIGLNPEIIRREIVYRRIYKQYFWV